VGQGLIDASDDSLELAAGYGDFTTAAPCRRRVAMDINPGLVDLLGPPIEAEVGDCTDLARFEDHSFDVVFASNFLEHLEWEGIDRCTGEVARVLRPGGRLLLLQPNFRLQPKRYFDDYTHRTIFTDQSLTDYLTSRGFEVDRCEARFLPLTMKSRLSAGHHLVPYYLRLPWRPLAGQMLVSARTKGGSN
jgi:ubiquinone/menaquinone biosynthesis C-methylase UbiE